jgi:hypothetical protein
MSPSKRGSCLLLALLFYALPAQAFRCGVYVVTEGEHALSVLQKCGEPQYRDEHIEYRELRIKGQGLEQARFEPVRVEQWLYNFGPRMFMQQLRFENGKLMEIKNLNYGF